MEEKGHHRREKASSSSEKKKEEANSTSPDHRLPEASTKASARRKRIKANPHQEPEFFPDQRNLLNCVSLRVKGKACLPLLNHGSISEIYVLSMLVWKQRWIW
ncbi:hypothetical protein MRB53_034325 [Persea americana]|uniref:Uncharacterized protein n=1 Tax=Persea americana TaxID=3435 RepID=A0ACC2KXJ2_PERAE|nr:hypothetical protein MRB53_034325 [Persea americana]